MFLFFELRLHFIYNEGKTNPNSAEERIKCLIYVVEWTISLMYQDASTPTGSSASSSSSSSSIPPPSLSAAEAAEINSKDKITLVMDFSDYGSRGKSSDSLHVAKTSVNILTNHYPERLGTCLIINSKYNNSLLN